MVGGTVISLGLLNFRSDTDGPWPGAHGLCPIRDRRFRLYTLGLLNFLDALPAGCGPQLPPSSSDSLFFSGAIRRLLAEQHAASLLPSI
jgi:hypothetical protein